MILIVYLRTYAAYLGIVLDILSKQFKSGHFRETWQYLILISSRISQPWMMNS